jgi:hypothetical protein
MDEEDSLVGAVPLADLFAGVQVSPVGALMQSDPVCACERMWTARRPASLAIKADLAPASIATNPLARARFRPLRGRRVKATRVKEIQ